MEDEIIIRKSWDEKDLKILQEFVDENPDISYYRAGRILSKKLGRSAGSISAKLYKLFYEEPAKKPEKRKGVEIGNIAESLEKVKNDLNDIVGLMAETINRIGEIEGVAGGLEKWVRETLEIKEKLLSYTVEKNGVVSDIKLKGS